MESYILTIPFTKIYVIKNTPINTYTHVYAHTHPFTPDEIEVSSKTSWKCIFSGNDYV